MACRSSKGSRPCRHFFKGSSRATSTTGVSGASYRCWSPVWAWTVEGRGCGVAEFRMLTWNVQNLFAAGSEDGPATQEAFDAKLASLAEVLDAQRPDVAALQELGPPEVLAQLQDRLTHELPHQQLSVHPDGRGIRGRVP
jgi:hypothetical protein